MSDVELRVSNVLFHSLFFLLVIIIVLLYFCLVIYFLNKYYQKLFSNSYNKINHVKRLLSNEVERNLL
jgi:uncharacterized protein (UPF0333 family)